MTDPFRRCDGISRRDLLCVGGLAAFGLGLPRLVAARRETPTAARARSCILIWLDGGPSHLETFDLKPEAPVEVRGPFESIETVLPGVRISEFLPNTARLLKHAAIIRSMTSTLGEHNFGTHYLMTGYRPTPALEYPCVGSVLAHLRSQRRILPAHVAVPDFRVGGAKFSGQGFLPVTCRPFSLNSDPGRKGFRVRDLDPFPGITVERIGRRREYLATLDRLSQALDAQPGGVDPEFEQACALVTSPEARQAFDLAAEPAVVRKRYGYKSVGQGCLLARRLVERGVPFVTVNARGWDTHADLVTRLKEGYSGAVVPVGLIPSLDLAFSALVNDLADRDLLDETLIVVMGEFGRTPKLNTGGGRDHWPRVFSVLLAGGGIRGGQVIGASDAVGESPAERPVTPSDLAATIYTLLGIDPAHELRTPDGRPVRVNGDGRVVDELIG